MSPQRHSKGSSTARAALGATLLCLGGALPLPAVAETPISLAEGPQGVGVGIIIGEPTGLSATWRRDGPSTFAGAVAWSVPDSRLHLHVDYLYQIVSFRDPAAPVVEFPVYVGVGPRLHLGDGVSSRYSMLGVRVPVGLGVQASAVPVEGFFELAPVLGLYPSTRMDFDAALGVRVYLTSRLQRVEREPASTWDRIEEEQPGQPSP
jgi:hypothetical protein